MNEGRSLVPQNREIIIDDAPRCKDGSTIENLIQQFVADKFALSQSQKTAKAYYNTVTAFRLRLLRQGDDLIAYSDTGSYDNIRVHIAEEAKVFALISTIPGKTVSTSTRNLRLSIITSFYAYAERNLKVPFTNPLTLVTRSKQEAYAGAKPLLPQEVKEHLQAIDTSTPLGKRDYALLYILFSTGRRVQDVINLSWNDVRLSRSEIATLNFSHMKGGKQRAIPLDKRVSKLLMTYLREVYGPSLEKIRADSPIWVNMSILQGNKKQRAKGMNEQGSALTYQAVRNICIKHLDNLGKVHTTRHTYTRLLQESGATIEEIQQSLDHSNIGTTQIYAKHLKKDADKYTENVVNLLGLGE